MKGIMFRVSSILLGAMLICCAGACGAREDSSGNSGSGTSGLQASSTHAGGKLAASLKDYLTNMNAKVQKDSSVSDSQKQIMEKSANNGVISAADYEAAWNNYKNCMTDRGYSTPVLRKFPNGMYQLPGINGKGGTQEQQNRLSSDSPYCLDSEVTAVDTAYSVQIGNPGLLSDPDEAMVDCFHKTGLVPASYTAQQWLKEKTAAQKSEDAQTHYSTPTLNMKDPQIRGCIAANGGAFTDFTDPNETVWYPFQK